MNVFDSSSSSQSDSQIDTTNFVKKSYLKTNYIETNMEEDIDMKNQYYIKNIPNPINSNDCMNKIYADTIYLKISSYHSNSIVRNDRNMNFNSTTFTGLNSIYVNKDPIYDTELATKQYTDTLVDESTILRNNQDNNLNNNQISNTKAISVNLIPNNKFDDYEINELVLKSIIDEFVSTNMDEATLLRLDNDEKLKISEQDYITLNSNLTSPKTILNLALHNQNLVKRNQDTDFQNQSLTYISSISVNELPTQNSHLCNKEYVDSSSV